MRSYGCRISSRCSNKTRTSNFARPSLRWRLEAHLERKGREVQSLAGLVDVDAAIAPLLVWFSS